MKLDQIPLIFSILLACLLVYIDSATANTKSSSNQQKSYSYDMKSSMDISYYNISSNLIEWNNDIALMFYAPWCNYCKQLYSSWSRIAALMKSKKSLDIGTFNCELNKKNIDFCKVMGIDRYPSVFYFGYGSFYQSKPETSMKSLSKEMKDRIVRYSADLYVEAIYEWINMLSLISYSQRKWDDITGFFTG